MISSELPLLVADWEGGNIGWRVWDGTQELHVSREDALAGELWSNGPVRLVIEHAHLHERRELSVAQVYSGDELQQFWSASQDAECQIQAFPQRLSNRARVEGIHPDEGVRYEELDEPKQYDPRAIYDFVLRRPEVSLKNWRPMTPEVSAFHGVVNQIRHDMTVRLNGMRPDYPPEDPDVRHAVELLESFASDLPENVQRQFGIGFYRNSRNPVHQYCKNRLTELRDENPTIRLTGTRAELRDRLLGILVPEGATGENCKNRLRVLREENHPRLYRLTGTPAELRDRLLGILVPEGATRENCKNQLRVLREENHPRLYRLIGTPAELRARLEEFEAIPAEIFEEESWSVGDFVSPLKNGGGARTGFNVIMAIYVAVYDGEQHLRRNEDENFIGMKFIWNYLFLMSPFNGRSGTARSNLIYRGLYAYDRAHMDNRRYEYLDTPEIHARRREVWGEWRRGIKLLMRRLRDAATD